MKEINVNIVDSRYCNLKLDLIKEKFRELGYHIFMIEDKGSKPTKETEKYIWLTKDGEINLLENKDFLNKEELEKIINEVRYIRYKVNDLYGNDLYGNHLSDLNITIYVNDDSIKITLPERIDSYNITVMKHEDIANFTSISIRKDCFMDLRKKESV